MATYISRNPFAREDLVRQTVKTRRGCDNCGSNRYDRLFEYGTEPDGLNRGIHWHDGQFCSKGCHDSYHGH